MVLLHLSKVYMYEYIYIRIILFQERVVVCTRIQGWDCNNDPGFHVNHSNHHEITLPKGFLKESGNFTCKIVKSPSDEVYTCAWSPSANVTDNDYEVSRNSSLLEGGSNNYITRDNSIIIASSVVSVFGAIGILIFIILLLKWRKSRRNKGFSKAGPNKFAERSEESCVKESDSVSQRLQPDDSKNHQDRVEGCVEPLMISSEQCETTHPLLISVNNEVEVETPDEIFSDGCETKEQHSGNKEEAVDFSAVKDSASIHLNKGSKSPHSNSNPQKRLHRRVSRKKTTNPQGSHEKEYVVCIFPPRLCVTPSALRRISPGVYHSAIITPTKEQSNLKQRDLPRLFLIGPPGTGKSVALILRCFEWLEYGRGVHIVSTGRWNRAACSMLYHLIQQITKRELAALIKPDQLHQHQYDFENNKEVEKAIRELSLEAKEGFLYVIADEVGAEESSNFNIFCEKLLSEVGGLHLWATTYSTKNIPNKWEKKRLTTPLRSPNVVLKEVMKQTVQSLIPYSEPLEDDKTDGPQIRQIDHGGHSEKAIQNCIECGREIGRVLFNLHGVNLENITTASTSNPSASGGLTLKGLQWRDMLVLHSDRIEDEDGIVQGLKEHVPVRVMTDDDIDDVATAKTDTVWVANGDLVRGLERQLIVCLGVNDNIRLRCMSRCTSQLVTINS